MNEHIPSIGNNRKRKLSLLVFVQAKKKWLCLDKPSHFFTHKPGQSTNMENNLSSNMHTKLNLIWTSEKASQAALNKFLCKINLYYLYLFMVNKNSLFQLLQHVLNFQTFSPLPWHFCFLGEKSLASVVKVLAATFRWLLFWTLLRR